MANIITISESIKQEIAEKVAEQASAGYSPDAQGNWYVVDGERVVWHNNATAQWKPWSDDAAVIHVNDLVWYFGGAKEENADFENGVDGADDFDLTVDFALGYVPNSYDQDIIDGMGA
jgi:hypothetical protein